MLLGGRYDFSTPVETSQKPNHADDAEAADRGPEAGRFHYRGNMALVPLAHSKVTAQGQVSVPAKVRQRLGVGPGSVLEWDEDGDRVIVRRAGRYSSEDIHRVLFPKTPGRRTIEEMKNGIRRYIKKRHAGR
jgi:AbrB family looped-hinge helix DNA binding protein